MSGGVGVNPDPSLLVVLEARERRWWLGARRVHAEFHAVRGLLGARFAGGSECGPLRWSDAEASARSWASPRAARFERSSPAGSFLETIWLPERLPALVIEARPVGEWLPGRPLGVRVEREPGIHLRAFGTTDAPLATPEGGARVELELVPTDPLTPITLVLLAGEPHPSTLRALLTLEAHAKRALPGPEAPHLSTGIDEVDSGVRWGWTRIRDRLLEGHGLIPPVEVADAAAWIRTALAVGLPEAAHAALPGAVQTRPEVEAWHAWAAGAGEAARASFEALEVRLGDAPGISGGERARLAEAAERAGLRRWAARLRTTPGTAGGCMPLPSLRATPASASAEGALESWRSRLTDAAAPLAPEGWRALEGVIGPLLGYHPDVSAGRLHLAPSPAAHWTRFEVRGVTVGEARIDLAYRREGGGEEWIFTPVAGGVPLTLILRLRVPDRGARVTVDGVPAELNIEEGGGEARAPVQLQLTGRRVVRIAPREPDTATDHSGMAPR